MITFGIDIGSVSAKAILIKDNVIIDKELIFSGYNTELTAKNLFKTLLLRNGIENIEAKNVVATGYGRKNVDFAEKKITEISCHAKGAYFLNNKVRTVIDIGGQDSKVISLDEEGNVKDFMMNDKCASGTGRFLEVMARALELDLETFAKISLSSKNPVAISSICTVFAESEVVSNIAKGNDRADIASGIHASVASRLLSMANRIALNPEIMMTGGVARNKAVVSALENLLKKNIIIDELAQYTGAIGAALFANKY